MKGISFVLLAMILILSFASVSMAAGDQTITVNPLGEVLNAQYERPLGDLSSLLISAGFAGAGNVNQFLIGAGYRKYLGEERSGLFGEGTIAYASASAPGVSATGFRVQGLCGFKWILDQGFTIEAGVGAGVAMINLAGYSIGGFGTTYRVGLGYTW
jgi:hypothetical protein